MSRQTCFEEVTRDDHADACGSRAVGFRLDIANDGRPYPVCRRHLCSPVYVPDYDAVLDRFAQEESDAVDAFAGRTSSDAAPGGES